MNLGKYHKTSRLVNKRKHKYNQFRKLIQGDK